jgi:K+-sensing histidine kinase KdpD
MEDDGRDLLVMAFGAGGAILLGMALIPLRELTPAANFSFCFVVLIIVVAEMGGRRAALATAFVSVLSLDFFLTQPYLTLAMTEKHDLIAFLGLAACGLVAALFRGQRVSQASMSRYLGLLDQALVSGEESGPASNAIGAVLESALHVLPVSAMMVRNPKGGTLLATTGAGGRPAPDLTLHPRSLLPTGVAGTAQSLSLPDEGGRCKLVVTNRTVGYLDVWGTGRPLTDNERKLLAMLAHAIAMRLAIDADPALASAPASLQPTV